MRMTADTIRRFPKLHYYVRVDMPRLVKNQKVVKAISKFSGRKPQRIRQALRWGTDPTVVLSNDGMNYGGYTLGTNEIQLDEVIVQEFEEGRGRVLLSSGLRIYLIGAVILHELTHWANFLDGEFFDVPDPKLRKRTNNEAGGSFELELYGRWVSKEWNDADPRFNEIL